MRFRKKDGTKFGSGIKNMFKNLEGNVTEGIDKWNEKVEGIKTPELQHGLSNNTMLFIGLGILAFFFLKK